MKAFFKTNSIVAIDNSLMTDYVSKISKAHASLVENNISTDSSPEEIGIMSKHVEKLLIEKIKLDNLN